MKPHTPTPLRIAVLDDYLRIAEDLAPWSSLEDADVTFLHDHIASRDELADRLGPFDVLAVMRERTPLPGELLRRLPNLRLIVTSGQQNASIDVEVASQRGILVCGTESLAHPTVELTWALILAASRQLADHDAGMRRGEWQRSLGVGLHGRRLGVIGLGRNGRQVARAGLAFGMDVVAWSHNLTADRAAEVGVQLVAKDVLLATSEVITIHLRLSPRTEGLIGPAELARMKPTAYLVNTSRGPIINEPALLDALRGRRIAGAALDVYDSEPLPPEHPLRGCDNVVLTPHLGYVTRENLELFYRQMVEDIAAYRAGAPIRVIQPHGLR